MRKILWFSHIHESVKMWQRVFLFLLLAFVIVSPELVAQGSSGFVTLTPCRVANTRWAAGPLGGPSMSASSTRTFPLPSSPTCNVPSKASAYSLNITVVPLAGYVGYLAVWPTGVTQPVVSTINDGSSAPLANAAIVPAGTGGAISVFVTNLADVIIDINGYFIAQTNTTSVAIGTGASNSGPQNTAIGYDTLQLNAGSLNTALGSSALAANSTGSNNTAVGASALFSNALGMANTAIGTDALVNNLVGNDNTAVGFGAMTSNAMGSSNVAVGASSLWNISSGSNNIAMGTSSLYSVTTGSWNIGIGNQAGSAVTNGNYNIDIGSSGTANDSGVIRIGTSGSQSSAYIAGITSTTVSGVPVLVDGNGQLGVQTSSIRFKQDIRDMPGVTQALTRLRPVIFRYRSADAEISKRLQYGLLAEEVEKVYPELVFRDDEDRPVAVAYHELPVLLLKEVQEQQALITQQQNEITSDRNEIKRITIRLQHLEKAAGTAAVGSHGSFATHEGFKSAPK